MENITVQLNLNLNDEWAKLARSDKEAFIEKLNKALDKAKMPKGIFKDIACDYCFDLENNGKEFCVGYFRKIK